MRVATLMVMVMVMVMSVPMPMPVRMAMCPTLLMLRHIAGADPFHMMVMTFLGQPDLRLKAQHLLTIFAELAVHIVALAQNIQSPLGESVEHKRMIIEIARLDELDIWMLRGDRIGFADGSEAGYDAVIHATGYRTEFPFLAPEIFDPAGDLDTLYRRMVSLAHPQLIFAGLVQPIGPTIPLVEIQGKWIAALLSGAMTLPSASAMLAEAEAHAAARRAQWLDAPRYALEVDFRSYAGKMRADMKAGAAGN